MVKQEDGSLKNSVILGDIWDVSDTKSTLQNEGHISFSGSKKPVKLITMLLDLIGQRSGVIFEMYGGASVVSHACLLKNKQEGTNFNFIVSQLPEKVDPKSFLVITFTNKAADNLKYKLRKELEDKDMVLKMQISTIHSFCLEYLKNVCSNKEKYSALTLIDDDASEKKTLFIQKYKRHLGFL